MAHVLNSPPNGTPYSSRPRTATVSSYQVKADRLTLDPEDVFSKHTIAEVKAILIQLHADVDAKQEELRLMVGERYRELLQASTSIISMHESSQRVLHSVQDMHETVRKLEPSAAVDTKEDTRRGDAQLQVLQCLTAHLKLLLDASEHLWRFQERKKYLQASWLFLLSRVVYRSLTQEGSDGAIKWSKHGIQMAEQFPLVQRQWETVSQFRAQISHRANLSLRELSLPSEDICGSLLALHLLDSLPLMDALDTLLKQRSRTLKGIYESIDAKTAGASSKPERSQKRTSRQIWENLQNVLEAVTKTLHTSRELFRETENSPPLIKRVLLFAHSDGNVTPEPPIPTTLQLTTRTLLSSLPNSNQFLPLPSDIRSYRPYIDLKSTSSSVDQRSVNSKLRKWFTTVSDQLKQWATSRFSALETVTSVWDVRSSFLSWLASSVFVDDDDRRELRKFLDELCKNRVVEICSFALSALLKNFNEILTVQVNSAEKGAADYEYDIRPAHFLLSTPPSPSISQVNTSSFSANSSLSKFRNTLSQRLDGTTPHLETIISNIESKTKDLHNDLERVFADESLRIDVEKAFIPSCEKTLDAILESLDKSLSTDSKTRVEKCRRKVFIGRVALSLSKSSFLSDLRCPAAHIEKFSTHANRVYDRAVEEWSHEIVHGASEPLISELIKPADSPETSLPYGPSTQCTQALRQLIEAIESWGMFHDRSRRSVLVHTILKTLSNTLSSAATKCTESSRLSTVWDLLFVKQICTEWDSELGSTIAKMSKAIKHAHKLLSPQTTASIPKLDTALQDSVLQSIPRMRLLLSPLLPPVISPSTITSIKSPKTPTLDLNHKSNKQKAVTKVPSSTATTSLIDGDIPPVLSLAKPSPRFGSLWVASSS